MGILNLDWYYTFLVLAKTLNYHKASEQIHLSEPSIYKQIRNLEYHLNVKLFEKGKKKLQLSKAGKEFVIYAQRLIGDYEQGVSSIRLFNEKSKAQLTVVVSPYIATYLMYKFLPIFFEAVPQVSVALQIVEKNLERQMEEKNYDICISREEPYSKKFSAEEICEGTIRLCVPNTPENKLLTEEGQFFEKYKVLSGNHPVYWENLKHKISDLVPDTKFMEVNDVQVTEKLVALNQGISYLPTYVLSDGEQQIYFLEPAQILPPLSFTYILTKDNRDEIVMFKNLFRDFIRKEQQKGNVH